MSIETWLPELQTQLRETQSHQDILAKLGYDRATISVFETMSRLKLPYGLPPIVAKIGANGDKNLEGRLIGYEGCTKELSDYSTIAVYLAERQLEGYHKKVQNIRKIIRICLLEMRNHPQLQSDILVAAKAKARLVASQKRLSIPQIVIKDFSLNLPSGDAVGRPVDWESSHWWSGE